MKDGAVLADLAVFIHVIVSVQHRAGADLGAIGNDHVRANTGFRMDLCFFRNNGRRMDAGGWSGLGVKEWHHLGKGQSGAWYTDEDLAFGSKILVDDDRTGCALFGAFKEGTVLGEGEVARAGAVGGLEAGEGHGAVSQHFSAQLISDISRCKTHGKSLSVKFEVGALKRLTASDDTVVFVQDNHFRFPTGNFGFVYGSKTHDRQPVAGLAQVRGGAVENDRATAGFAGDGIGFEPLAVTHVTAEHPLIGQQADFLHQRAVHREAALVVDVGVGHRSAMNFGFEHLNLHFNRR